MAILTNVVFGRSLRGAYCFSANMQRKNIATEWTHFIEFIRQESDNRYIYQMRTAPSAVCLVPITLAGSTIFLESAQFAHIHANT